MTMTPKDPAWTSMKVHPEADVSIPMTDEEYDGLKANIVKEHLRVPIVLWRDKKTDVVWIIDGKHRHLICLELGCACPATWYLGKEEGIHEYALSLNAHRRHVDTPDRKAMAIAKANGLRHGGDRKSSERGEHLNVTDAAAKHGVPVSRVRRATTVVRKGTKELASAVEAGEVALSVAAEIAQSTPKKDQAKALQARQSKPRKKAEPKPPPVPVDTVTKEEYNKLVDDYNELNTKHNELQDKIQSYEDVRADKSVSVMEQLRGQLRMCHNRRDELMNKSAGDEKVILSLQRKLKKYEAKNG